jgi:hypothetical protein
MIITIVLLHNWNKLSVNVTKRRKMMSRFTKSCIISSKKKEHVKVYYKQIFKLANCLQIKVTNTYLTIIFKVGLHRYILLLIVGMKWETLIEHKEAMVVTMKKLHQKAIIISLLFHIIRMEFV